MTKKRKKDKREEDGRKKSKRKKKDKREEDRRKKQTNKSDFSVSLCPFSSTFGHTDTEMDTKLDKKKLVTNLVFFKF